MKRGGRVFVLFGLVLGLITAGGTFVFLSTQTTAPQIPTRSVIIAMQPIPERSEIPAQAIGRQEWPEYALPPGAIVFDKIEDVAGKLSLVPIYQGQIIMSPMIIDKREAKEKRSDASFLIPEGKVAVAFPIAELSGVAGALQAGDVVDILLTLNPTQLPSTRTGTPVTSSAGTEGLPVTQLMLQNVMILQVGAWRTATSQEKGGPSAFVTFVLDRQDALTLKSAREQGTIELVLRPALKDGDKAFTTEPVNLQYLNKRFNFNLVPLPTR